MENPGGASNYTRNRRFGSQIHHPGSSAGSNLEETSKLVAKEDIRERPRADISIEDKNNEEGWGCVMISWIRIGACFAMMTITTLIWGLIMVLLLPWPYQRIRQGNMYGHVTGRLLVIKLIIPICLNFCSEFQHFVIIIRSGILIQSNPIQSRCTCFLYLFVCSSFFLSYYYYIFAIIRKVCDKFWRIKKGLIYYC